MNALARFFQNAYLVVRIIRSLFRIFTKETKALRLLKLRTELELIMSIASLGNARSNITPTEVEILGDKRQMAIFEARVFDLNSNNTRAEEKFVEAEKLRWAAFTQIETSVPRPIRFIGSDITGSIGHTAKCLALRKKISDLTPEYPFEFRITSAKSPNSNYLSYWSEIFPPLVMNKSIEGLIEKELWPFYENVSSVSVPKRSLPLFRAHDHYSREWEIFDLPPILKLRDLDQERGYDYLRAYGFEHLGNDRFVTLHVRNHSVFQRGRSVSSSLGRNAHIQNYQPAVDYLLSHGFFVIRIGESDGTTLKPHPRFLDYTLVRNQKDFLNTFFLAECEFLIGTNSGPICVPSTFGKPVIMTNAPSIGRTAYFSNSLMIPKLVLDDRENVLSLEEMVECGAFWSDSTIRDLDSRSFHWRDNSPDEILSAVREMHEKKNLIISANQEALEKRLRKMGAVATANVSDSFVSTWNQALLGIG